MCPQGGAGEPERRTSGDKQPKHLSFLLNVWKHINASNKNKNKLQKIQNDEIESLNNDIEIHNNNIKSVYIYIIIILIVLQWCCLQGASIPLLVSPCKRYAILCLSLQLTNDNIAVLVALTISQDKPHLHPGRSKQSQPSGSSLMLGCLASTQCGGPGAGDALLFPLHHAAKASPRLGVGPPAPIPQASFSQGDRALF